MACLEAGPKAPVALREIRMPARAVQLRSTHQKIGENMDDDDDVPAPKPRKKKAVVEPEPDMKIMPSRFGLLDVLSIILILVFAVGVLAHFAPPG